MAGLDFDGAVFCDRASSSLGGHAMPTTHAQRGATGDVLNVLLVGPALLLFGARGKGTEDFRAGVRGAAFGIGLWNVINGGLSLALRARHRD